MTLADDLIITARQLAHLHERRPRQADLRRAISTATQKTAAWTRVLRQRADDDPNTRYKHGEVLSAVNDAEVALGMTRS